MKGAQVASTMAVFLLCFIITDEKSSFNSLPN